METRTKPEINTAEVLIAPLEAPPKTSTALTSRSNKIVQIEEKTESTSAQSKAVIFTMLRNYFSPTRAFAATSATFLGLYFFSLFGGKIQYVRSAYSTFVNLDVTAPSDLQVGISAVLVLGVLALLRKFAQDRDRAAEKKTEQVLRMLASSDVSAETKSRLHEKIFS